MQESITDTLRGYDTCTLADALAKLNLQAHSQGYSGPGLHCFTSSCSPVAGYAATARIRAADAPVTGHHFFRHSEWWSRIETLPEPRIVVIEDMDREPGSGACLGQVGAALFQALKCVAAVTNGAVRDVDTVDSMGFALFAAHVTPSRAYAHMIDHGQPVEIFSLPIHSGDLLVADRHGLIAIPLEHASEVCARAEEVRSQKKKFIDCCRSPRFSLDDLDPQLKELQI